MAVFVFGPLPSERARVRITAVKPKYAVGEVIEFIERSVHRAQPFCPVFGICGGCQVQHLNYDQQLDWKRGIVRNALQRIGGIQDARVEPTIGMGNPREYRNKMALVVDHASASTGFGLYKQRSHDIVPIEQCPIVQRKLNQCLEGLIDARRDPTLSAVFSRASHLVARTSRASGQSVVTVTTRRAEQMRPSASNAMLKRLPGVAGITQSFDLASENAILGRRQRTLAGTNAVEETVGGIRLRISASSFFQVNIEVLERIFEKIAPMLAPPRRIIDLYCGSGAFTLLFAKFGCDVFAVEENASAVAEARENAALNRLSKLVTFRCGRVEQILQRPEGAGVLRAADTVFLDPPRKGSDPQTLSTIAAAGTRALWYLACDPATLARDLKLLVAKGYCVSSVQPFDMFPQTGHVETLAVLSRMEH